MPITKPLSANAKGVFLYVNPTWCKITGLEQTDALYRSAAAFAHDDERDAVSDHWATAVQTATLLPAPRC